MKLTVKVTEYHIESGVQVDCKLCPIALAVQDYLNSLPEVCQVIGVGTWTMVRDKNGKVMVGENPREALEFMRNFDNHGKRVVKPFEFELVVK